MRVLTVAELAEDPSHDGLIVVDFDAATDDDCARAASALDAALIGPRLRAVRVGLCVTPPGPGAGVLLERLTTTLAPGDDRRCAGGPEDLPVLAAQVARSPQAAVALADLLPLTAALPTHDAVVAESFAYSCLLAGPEFTAWRASTPARTVPDCADPVKVTRDGGALRVRLNRPERRNAFGRSVRDALLEGMELARLDPSVTSVVMDGAGTAFCSGGDLDEFGTAPDPATAHHVRLARHAGLAVHAVRDRVKAVVHGACVGAGIEIPSFAGHLEAHDDAFFCLPELGLGLVPGAGGTVSVTARIGRWRTAYLVLTGHRIDVTTALAWGLVDGRAGQRG